MQPGGSERARVPADTPALEVPPTAPTGPGPGSRPAADVRSGERRGPGDLLVLTGVVLFGVGVAAVVVVFVMFLVTGGEVPTALSLTCALAPVGLGLALLGLFRQGRAASRPARRNRSRDRH